jgi:hypothetical protein
MRRLLIALIGIWVVAAPAVAAPPEAIVGTYDVAGVRTSLDRSAVAATGAAIVEVDHASVVVTASPSDLRRLRRLPYGVTPHAAPAAPAAPDTPPRERSAAAFPPADSAYHSYQEWVDETTALVAAHPSLVTRTQIGTSYENRPIWALKVSDNAATDEAEPEILLTHNQHAREHLTVEMALYLLHELTDGYATDARIRAAVDGREIWIVPSVNPDGAEFDVATGDYVLWRKNRQPTPAAAIGTDLNRNWDFLWGCCGGSSGDPASETYRGPSPFSAPETQAVRNFVRSRRIDGVQQIKAAIDFHTYGELVLWPFGYTFDDTAAGLDADQHAAFVAIGQSMAASNGYTAQQSSDLYITDGSIDDWLWGTEGVFAFTFEMYPTTASPGFYPPDEAIAAQTARNREAVLRLLEIADCPYRAIGKQASYCAPAAPPPAPPADPPPVVVVPPPPAAPPATPAPGPLATALTARVGVGADGRVRLRLNCRATAPARCRGTITLKARLPGGRGRATTIARASYSVAAGRRTLTLRLRAAARRALRARATIAATAAVLTRQRNGFSRARGHRVVLVRRP